MSEPNPAVIEVEDVHKSFGDVPVLRGISFHVEEGETLCILGASGDGKTTMLKVLMGVERPDSGRVSIYGQDVYDADPEEVAALRRKIGVNGQVPSSQLIAERRADRLAWEREHADELAALREVTAGHDVQQPGEPTVADAEAEVRARAKGRGDAG